MKFLRFLPLAYLANVDGFVLFAPYLLFTLVVTHLVWARRRRAERVAVAGADDAVDVDARPAGLALS